MRKFLIKFISFLLAVVFYIPALLLLIILGHTGPVPSLGDLMGFFHCLLVGKTYKDLKKSYREFKREFILSKTSKRSPDNQHFVTSKESEQNKLTVLKPLDVAFLLSKEGYSAATHGINKQKLQNIYPVMSFEEITEIYLRACKLADFCYDAGERLITSSWKNQDEILKELEVKFPGFSQQTYNNALSWGCFLSR